MTKHPKEAVLYFNFARRANDDDDNNNNFNFNFICSAARERASADEVPPPRAHKRISRLAEAGIPTPSRKAGWKYISRDISFLQFASEVGGETGSAEANNRPEPIEGEALGVRGQKKRRKSIKGDDGR